MNHTDGRGTSGWMFQTEGKMEKAQQSPTELSSSGPRGGSITQSAPQCGSAGKKEAQRQPLQLEGRNRHIHFVSTTESRLTFFSSQQSNPTLPAARHS